MVDTIRQWFSKAHRARFTTPSTAPTLANREVAFPQRPSRTQARFLSEAILRSSPAAFNHKPGVLLSRSNPALLHCARLPCSKTRSVVLEVPGQASTDTVVRHRLQRRVVNAHRQIDCSVRAQFFSPGEVDLRSQIDRSYAGIFGDFAGEVIAA